MDEDDIIARAYEVFAAVERPAHFTNHTHCCECADHDRELQPFRPQTVPRAALGSMAWDPITFTSNQGFRYYLPGMIRIVLTESGSDSYYEQFLWHILGIGDERERHAACTEEERKVVLESLEFLLEHRTREIEREMLADELLSAIEKWSGAG